MHQLGVSACFLQQPATAMHHKSAQCTGMVFALLSRQPQRFLAAPFFKRKPRAVRR
jgi:hypothetical protein